MSIYNPPTFSEYLSVFNPANWGASDAEITEEYLEANYAQYPVIQGSNYTLKNTLVQGNLTIENTKDKITFADSNNNGGLVLGTSTTAPNCNALNSIFIGKDAGKYLTNNVFACVALGRESLSNENQIASANTEYFNTAIGNVSLSKAVNTDGNTIANTGCGFASLSNLLTGNNNSSLGSQSGSNISVANRLINGSSNTFLGSKSGLDSSLTNTCNHSTAVGADAFIEFSNCIQLGTNLDFVNIPNYIRFSDNTTQSTASNVGLVNITSFGAIGDGVFNCTTAINNAIATLAGGNKTLYIPQGKFLISGSLIFQGTNVGASLTPLRNVNIFSEGTILATGSNYNAIYISNVDKFSINGNLVIDGTGSSLITAIKVSDVSNGAGGWYEAIFNLNISNITVSNCHIGIYCQATGFSPKIYSDFCFYTVGTAIENRGEYNLFNNINATNGYIGILNYGGNNTYSNGTIKQYSYGGIVANVPSVAGNPDHGGFYNIIFNHNNTCGIIIHYTNDSWVVSNCNIYANGNSALGNPLNLIPVAYQSYACSGIYIQGCSRVNILNNVIGLNTENPLSINGSNNCVISNNQFFQTSGSTYISVIGTTIQGGNTTNTFTNNSFASNFTENTVPAITYSNSISASTISLSSNNIVANNTGNILTLKVFDNVGASTTQYIDGSVPFYRINAGQTDTLYLTNIVAGSEFEIQFSRATPTFNALTTFTDVYILLSGFGGINDIPILCDGLTGETDGTYQIIRFHKAGTYSFRPSLNAGINTNTGQYTVFPTFADLQLYFAPSLFASGGSAIRLDSPLFYNSVVNISNSLATPNVNITLPIPNFGTGSHYVGATLQIFNNTNFVLTLNRPAGSGLFRGAYGNESSTISLPDNTWTTITFDGIDYLINERSANYSFLLTSVPAGVSYVNNFNLTNATVNLSLTSAGLVNIPVPSATRSIQTTSIFNNIGVHQLTLQISSGTFSGKYGSGGTQLIVPVGCWVQIFSDKTNWRVDDRSKEFNLFLFGIGNTLDWSNNYQYLDTAVEFVDTTHPLNTTADFNVTGSIAAGSNILVVTATSGVICIGSSLVIGGKTLYITSQDYFSPNTAGGLGSYRLSGYFANVVVSATYTMKGGCGVCNSGTITSTASSLNNLQLITVNTQTTGAVIDTGAQLTINTLNDGFCNIIERGTATTGTGTYYITTQAGLTTRNYYSSSATNILLPSPSDTLIGRTITIRNNSYAPVNITTSARTAIFSGRFSAGYILGNATTETSYTRPKNHLLKAQETVVLICDGTYWETQEGTSFGGAKTFSFAFTTNVADGVYSGVYPYAPFTNTCQSLNALTTNATAGSGTYLINLYPFPITVCVTASVLWNTPVKTAVLNTIPNRLISLSTINSHIFSSAGVVPRSTSAVSGANTTYTMISEQCKQLISNTIVLQPATQIAVNSFKVNSDNLVAETGSGYITFVRIA